MTKTLTYGQLYDKLVDLGYDYKTLEINGKRHRVFRHKTIDNAMIGLPERDRNDLVEPFFMSSVLGTLRSRHILPECNPLTDCTPLMD
jgi:hypothetical protein